MEKNTKKTYFNFDGYNKLFQVISVSKDEFAKEDLEALDDATTQCRKYVDVVDATEQQIRLASVRFEGDAYREMITRYDTQRRSAHEAAIASVSLINKLAELYGCTKVYTGGSDRLEVADFCLEVTVAIFNNRRK